MSAEARTARERLEADLAAGLQGAGESPDAIRRDTGAPSPGAPGRSLASTGDALFSSHPSVKGPRPRFSGGPSDPFPGVASDCVRCVGGPSRGNGQGRRPTPDRLTGAPRLSVSSCPRLSRCSSRRNPLRRLAANARPRESRGGLPARRSRVRGPRGRRTLARTTLASLGPDPDRDSPGDRPREVRTGRGKHAQFESPGGPARCRAPAGLAAAGAGAVPLVFPGHEDRDSTAGPAVLLLLAAGFLLPASRGAIAGLAAGGGDRRGVSLDGSADGGTTARRRRMRRSRRRRCGVGLAFRARRSLPLGPPGDLGGESRGLGRRADSRSRRPIRCAAADARHRSRAVREGSPRLQPCPRDDQPVRYAKRLDQTHSDPLQLLVEQGVLGLISGLFFIAMLLRAVVRSVSAADDPGEKRLLAGFAGALAALACRACSRTSRTAPPCSSSGA